MAPRTAFRTTLLLGLLTFSLPLVAQVDPGPCDSCYKNYVDDRTLTIGAHQIQYAGYAQRTGGMTLSHVYQTDMQTILKELKDSSTVVEWKVDAAHPWGGFWELQGIAATTRGDSVARIDTALRGMNYREMLARGMKISILPRWSDAINRAAIHRESFYTLGEHFQQYLLCEPVLGITGNIAANRRSTWDTLTGEFFWTTLVPRSGSGGDTLIGGRPDFVKGGIPNDSNFYQELYDAAGVTDHSTFLSIGAAIRVDEAYLRDPEIGDGTEIAYIQTYLRNRVEPNSVDCRCRFMEPFRKISITKGEFFERLEDEDENGVSRYQAHVDRFIDIDTVIDFAPVWGDLVNPYGGPTGGETCDSICEVELARRLALGSADPEHLKPGTKIMGFADQGEEFTLEVYSTRVVDLSLLRTRVATPHFTNLFEGRYDSLIALDVDEVYSDPLLDSLIGQIGPGDEQNTADFRNWGMISGKLQREMDAHPTGKDRPKQIWANPVTDFDGFRLLAGDFDSTAFKQVQVAVRQVYDINGDEPIPVFYANPDQLGDKAWQTTFRTATNFEQIGPQRNCVGAVIDTGIVYRYWDRDAGRLVRLNDSLDHAEYNAMVQNNFFRAFGQRTFEPHSCGTTIVTLKGGTVSGTARLVDVFRIKYRDRFPNIPATPVWNVVQTAGFMAPIGGSLDSMDYFRSKRPPTPEELVAQCWLSMASGASGIIFGDIQFSGENAGLQTIHIYDDDLYDDLEYGMYRSTNQSKQPDNEAKWRIDDMWLGFRSRNAAITEVSSELHHIDSVIGWDNLLYDQEQMTLYDTLQNFAEVPMVRNLRMERAKQYEGYDTGTKQWTFEGSDTIDARAETYAELTHFAISDQPGVRAILVANRLCWPIDMNTYSASADTLFDALVMSDDYSLTGLGAIDVRRPLVTFENNTSVIADSFRIERIHPTITFVDTLAFGEEVELDWLRPGRGALYTIECLPVQFNEHSTAYNNAVRSENPQTDSTTGDRLVVYSRDSAVYAQTVDPTGVWSRAIMISDPADTVLVSGKRTASNFFPALAILRDGSGHARFVWERDSAGYRSVVTASFSGTGPIDAARIDSIVTGADSVVRHSVSIADSLDGPPALTPSIVATQAFDTTSGFVISWADHTLGVNALVMRPQPTPGPLALTDTAGLYRLHRTDFAVDVGQYPTLATADILTFLNVDEGTVGGRTSLGLDTAASGAVPDPEGATWWFLPVVHLAWQQGDGIDGDGERIYHNRLGAIIPDADTLQPTIFSEGTIEHVSKNVSGCSFEHPSIAADSVQVGVSFESYGSIGTTRVVTLKHRDTLGTDPATGLPLKAWETTYYMFGNVFKSSPFNVGYAKGENVRPSLTHFPELDSNSLLVQPEGGLVWFWQDNTDGRGHPQYMYRYGWFTRRSLDEGAHPSLTLVPLVATNPFEQSSVLHRGDSAERVVGTNDEGTSVWYYSGNLLNTPGNPLPALFNDPPSTGGIVAGVSAFTKDPSLEAWCQPIHRGFDHGLFFDHPTTEHPDDDRHPPGDPGVITSAPGLPPTFFQPGLGGSTIIDTLDGAERISRTGLFAAGDGSVDIVRYAAARDSVSLWLDTQPFDTQRGVAANIWSVVELVRASDSVVLWRGDTLTARGLDTTTSPVRKTLSVPVGTWADSGEVVWIQVRGFATDGVGLSVSGGFTFFESLSIPPAAKRGIGRGAQESGSSTTTLDLAVVPNPVTSDRAVLHVRNTGEGRITVTLWDSRGRLLRELPKIDGMRAGVYSVELDLEGLASGAYLLRAERGGEVTVESMTIP